MDITPVGATTSPRTARVEGPVPLAPVARVEAPAPAEPRAREREAPTPRIATRVEVGWHAPSNSTVHRFIDVHTQQPVRQFPAAQVLEVVADLMRRIRNV